MKTRVLVIALVVSAALNLGLIGFLVGAGSLGPRLWAPPGFSPVLNVERQMRFLPEERRQELAATVPSERRRVRAVLRDMRQAQGEIWEAVRAEPFERAALAAALERFRERFEAHQELAHATFVDIAAQLTAEERLRFADTVRHMERRRPDRDRRQGRERPERPRP